MAANTGVDGGHERDSADLAQFGYKQELKRSLGTFSSFAVAFSYISPSTGIFTLFALGLTTLGGVFIWTWPVVALGQFIIALNFAEVSSHYPVAGSVFQWTKYLSSRRYSWFTGWVYLFAGILTVTAVVATLPLALIPAFEGLGWHGLQLTLHTELVFALITLVVITILNIYGVRLVAVINNTGVLFEILGMFVFALILLAFHNHQGIHVITNSAGIHVAPNTFLAAMFMSLFVIYGFDTASTLAEETRDPRRAAPKAVLGSVIGAFVIGGVFLLGTLVAIPNLHGAIKGAYGPAQIIEANFSAPFATIYLLVVSAAIFVCCLSIMAATIRLCFGMSRDNQLPFSSLFSKVFPSLHTPVFACIVVAVLSADPLHPVLGGGHHRHRGHRDDLPELLPGQPGHHASPAAGLAQDDRAVQARPLGAGGERDRPALRRRDAGQLRLAAGGQQPGAEPDGDRRGAVAGLPHRVPEQDPDPVDRDHLHRPGRRDLLPGHRAQQGVLAGHRAVAG